MKKHAKENYEHDEYAVIISDKFFKNNGFSTFDEYYIAAANILEAKQYKDAGSSTITPPAEAIRSSACCDIASQNER